MPPLPFEVPHLTLELEVKLLPFMVMYCFEDEAVIGLGLMLEMVGAGLLLVAFSLANTSSSLLLELLPTCPSELKP